VENASEGIWLADENSITTFINKRMADMLGYSIDEMIGTYAPRYADKEYIHAVEYNIEKRKTGMNLSSEYAFVRKDCSLLWTISNSTPLLDKSGNFMGTLAIITDITERKRAEEALNASNRTINKILDSIQDDFYVLGHDWNFVFASKSFTSRVGKEPKDFVGNNIWEMFPKHLGTVLEENYRAAMDKRETRRFELHGQYTDHWYMMTVSPSAEGITVLGTEITERKLAEEALVATKMQAELYLDLMGHDISNMHQIAMGQLELANEIMDEKGWLNAEEKELIQNPLETLNRSARLIENVRNLQRMRRGEFKEESIDLNDLLANIVKEHEFMLPSDSIRFTGDGPNLVKANKLLHDVFSNIIGNAIKHSNGDGININIKLENANEDGKNYYKVSVEDTGSGIPDDMKDKVFNRLQRGNTKARGMGLGLYIVKSLVDSYNGRVWVEDRVRGDHRKGSRFVVLLPALEE
jgi:PAS domain S-box-containing protein